MEHRHTKEELNQAILEVLTTKYKKDAPEAHKLVESEGYRIYKSDGEFVVCNDKTSKRICGRFYPFYTDYIIRNKNTHVRKCSERRKRTSTAKIDLISYLDTPHNKAWQAAVIYHTDANYLYQGYTIPVKRKFAEYVIRRRNSVYFEHEIENTKKTISKLTASLEELIRKDIEAKQEFEDYKRKVGLIK